MSINLDPNMAHYLLNMCCDSRGFAEQEQIFTSCVETINITDSLNSPEGEQTASYMKNVKLSTDLNSSFSEHMSCISVYYRLYTTTPVPYVDCKFVTC